MPSSLPEPRVVAAFAGHLPGLGLDLPGDRLGGRDDPAVSDDGGALPDRRRHPAGPVAPARARLGMADGRPSGWARAPSGCSCSSAATRCWRARSSSSRRASRRSASPPSRCSCRCWPGASWGRGGPRRARRWPCWPRSWAWRCWWPARPAAAACRRPMPRCCCWRPSRGRPARSPPAGCRCPLRRWRRPVRRCWSAGWCWWPCRSRRARRRICSCRRSAAAPSWACSTWCCSARWSPSPPTSGCSATSRPRGWPPTRS